MKKIKNALMKRVICIVVFTCCFISGIFSCLGMVFTTHYGTKDKMQDYYNKIIAANYALYYLTEYKDGNIDEALETNLNFSIFKNEDMDFEDGEPKLKSKKVEYSNFDESDKAEYTYLQSEGNYPVKDYSLDSIPAIISNSAGWKFGTYNMDLVDIGEFIIDKNTGKLYAWGTNDLLYLINDVKASWVVDTGDKKGKKYEFRTENLTYSKKQDAYIIKEETDDKNKNDKTSSYEQPMESLEKAVFLETENGLLIRNDDIFKKYACTEMDDGSDGYDEEKIQEIYDAYGVSDSQDVYTCYIDVIEEDNIYSVPNYSLKDSCIKYMYNVPSDEEFYWIASYVDEDYPYHDLFSQAKSWVDCVFAFRNYYPVIIFMEFILCLISFVYLMYLAGVDKEGKINLGYIDRFPLEIMTAAVITAEVFLMGAVYLVLDGLVTNITVAEFISIETLIIITGVLLGLFFCNSIAKKVKLKCLLKYSICYKIWDKIRRCISAFVNNIKLTAVAILLVSTLLIDLIFASTGSCDVLILWEMFSKILAIGIIYLAIIQMKELQEGAKKLRNGELDNPIDTKKLHWEFKAHGENLNGIGEGINKAVMDKMKSERFKTELITNVSHDIKTPLTSIINYVDLLKKLDIKDAKENEYIEVLERQSVRLKKLIEDLMEASKASTGNLPVNLEPYELKVFITQIVGEFQEKLDEKNLELIVSDKIISNDGTTLEYIHVLADGRHLWRVIDNFMNNICKYAMPSSRVYIDIMQEEDKAVVEFKNMSAFELNISSEELMERFVRGDSSRNTEGSGLGLSIAKSLTELMGGTMDLVVDGDLFKVVLKLPVVKETN